MADTFIHQRFLKRVQCAGCTVLGTGNTRPTRFPFWKLNSSESDNQHGNKIKINVSAIEKINRMKEQQ